MDTSGLLKALALLLTGAVIPLIPVIYVAVFGQQSLIDWYRKRAAGAQGERIQAIAAKTAAQEKARSSTQTTSVNTRKRSSAATTPATRLGDRMSLIARWGVAVFMLIAFCLDIDEDFPVTSFLGVLLVATCILSPILLGFGIVLAVSGAQAASIVLAIGLAALLLLIFLFGGFLLMGLLLALGLEAVEL